MLLLGVTMDCAKKVCIKLVDKNEIVFRLDIRKQVYDEGSLILVIFFSWMRGY